MKDRIIIIAGRTYKVFERREHRSMLVLVDNILESTGRMFIFGCKVYIASDIKLEYMHINKDDTATALCVCELNKIVGVKGSKDNFILEKVNGRMYRVYELKY